MIEDVIKTMEQSDVIKKIKDCKERINQDSTLQSLLRDFNKEKEVYYETGFVTNYLREKKEAVYRSELVKEWKIYETELNKEIQYLNDSLTNLLHSSKNCIKKAY